MNVPATPHPHFRIYRIKALMPHREDFLPPNECSSWSLCSQWEWNVPHPSIISAAATRYLHVWWRKNSPSRLAVGCLRFQRMEALESIRKHPQNRVQNLEKCAFLYIQIAGNISCCMQWICSHRIMYFGIKPNRNTGSSDRDLFHVHPVSSNFFTKLRTLFAEHAPRFSLWFRR